MKYELVIFDLDGTILDTLEDLADSMNHALAKYGYPTRTIDEVRSFVGNGLLMLTRKAIAPETDEEMIQTVLAEQKAYYKEHCADKTKPYEGIMELLDALKANGCKLAVVSNKADYAVQILCEQYFPGIFHLTVGEKEGVRRKPAPDSVNTVLKELQVERVNAVYIGDSEVDIETAENAQMQAVLVDWGFRDAKFLEEKGAKTLVHTVKELKSALIAEPFLL
ncbi:MAG: HAD-IA family hydrolase [Roseburia sp.]|nr:HAD-IA family hydrolase [Roseburia sp.]